MQQITTIIKTNKRLIKITFNTLINVAVAVYFAFATVHYIDVDSNCKENCGMDFCNGYGSLVIVLALVYYSLSYYYVLKPTIGKSIYRTFKRTIADNGKTVAL